ncbi:MAG: metallophosphoesterase family protein [Dehalococcoidia bacterium]
MLADTHVNQLQDMPAKIVEAISTVDLIMHAGDFTDVRLLTGLKQLKDVRAVQGNMDSMQLRTILPMRDIVEVQGKRIGITHGSGASPGIDERIRKEFDGDRVDVIVYGHSHRAQNEVIDGVLFFNPGTATESFGILTVDDGVVKGEIVGSRQ